jgi:hypothetical protein
MAETPVDEISSNRLSIGDQFDNDHFHQQKYAQCSVCQSIADAVVNAYKMNKLQQDMSYDVGNWQGFLDR